MSRKIDRNKRTLNTEIGQRIAEIRRKKDYTQEALAVKIDVSTQFISNLERGLVGVSIETLIKICRTLDISSDYILMGKKINPQKSSQIQLNNLTPEQLDHVSQALNLLLISGNR